MITRTVESEYFFTRARQIKALTPPLLSQWGLIPKFKRWRLTQDPGTGMVVLFGVLNTKYIATHTTTPFSNYFDPRLLRDLATELHVQVISSANDGLRYAFILKKGQIGIPPVLKDLSEYQAADQSSLDEVPEALIETRSVVPQLNTSMLFNDLALMHQRLVRFLKMAEVIYPMNFATGQCLPDVLFMDEVEFNRQGRVQSYQR
jgi:hypothetical protein